MGPGGLVVQQVLGQHLAHVVLIDYMRDPWGSWIEYFTDIDQISENWQGRDWDVPPAVWCPMMPDDFRRTTNRNRSKPHWRPPATGHTAGGLTRRASGWQRFTSDIPNGRWRLSRPMSDVIPCRGVVTARFMTAASECPGCAR